MNGPFGQAHTVGEALRCRGSVQFSLDASTKATATLAIQINRLLDQLIPKGPEAVAQLGHTLFARVVRTGPCVYYPAPPTIDPTPPSILSTCVAQQIWEGR